MQNNDLLVALGGHIDHGKTSLIKAINGFDGDENKEEKQRGITLDISFSNLALKERNIAFIDVPGHEKLVKNMIAGAFGVDLLCLVVASDDGIMPQTKEHLEIANLLKIPKCLCVITKTDKATKEEIAKLKKEIQALFAPLKIQLDSLLEFSLSTQERDLPALLSYFATTPKPQKKDIGFFRYYIDRAFSISGAGCVVSGSALSGEVKKGDKLYIYDLAKEVSVKNLKIHSDFALSALPSHRVALNLNGIQANALKRGYLIAPKGYLRGFDSLDVILYTSNPLPSCATLHIGAKKTTAKITLLAPIENLGYLANLKTQDKIFSIFKEAFILRSDNQTLCGGEILSPIADPIKKSQKITLLKALNQEDFSSAFEILTLAHPRGFGLISATQRFGLSHAQALEVARTLPHLFVDSAQLVLYAPEVLIRLRTMILEILQKNPNAMLSASSLKLKSQWASLNLLQSVLNALHEEKKIQYNNGLYTSTQIKIDNPQDFLADKIYQILHSQGYAPQAPYNLYDDLQIDRKLGDQALKKLCASQKIVRLEHNLFVTSTHLKTILTLMRQIIDQIGYIDITLFKSHLDLSRKYLIAYLDYLDHFEDIAKEGTKRFYRHKRS